MDRREQVPARRQSADRPAASAAGSRTSAGRPALPGPASRRRPGRPHRRCPRPPGWRPPWASGRTAIATGGRRRRRLTSSGIRRSNERRPASTWATGTPWLGGHEGGRERRVRVAVDEDRIRPGRRQRSGRGRPASAPSGRPRATTDPEVVVGRAQAELAEERARQRVVVVLTGVDGLVVEPRSQRRLERGGLDQLRSRPDDADDPHAAVSRRRPAPAGRPAPPRRDRRRRHPVGRRSSRGCSGRHRRPAGPGTTRDRGPARTGRRSA